MGPKQHNETNSFMGLSNRAIAFSSLVALAVTTQTAFRLSQRNGQYEYNTFSAMTIVEFIKLQMSLIHHYKANYNSVELSIKSLRNAPTNVVIDYAVLAASYAEYNQLIFASLKTVDPGTFSIFKSFTPVIVSLMNYFFFSSPLSMKQWGCILVQICGMIPIITPKKNDDESNESQIFSNHANIALIVFTISMGSLNTAYNANKIKGGKIPVQVQNIVLYTFGFMFNLCFYIFLRDPEKHFFYGYENPGVIMLLVLNSFVGIAITMIYKYGDAVLMTMVQPASSSMLIFISYIFFGMPLDLLKMLGAALVISITVVFLKLPPPLEGKKRGKGVSIEVIRMVVIGFVLIAGKIVTKSVSEKDVLLGAMHEKNILYEVMREKDVLLESRQEGGKLPIVLIVQALKLRKVDIFVKDKSNSTYPSLQEELELENREKLAIFESYGAHFEHLIYDTAHYIEDTSVKTVHSVCSSESAIGSYPTGANASCFHCDIPYDRRHVFDRSRYACASKAMANLDASLKASVKGFLVIHADFFLLPTFLVTARKIMDENPNSFWLPSINNFDKGTVQSFGVDPFVSTKFDLSWGDSKHLLSSYDGCIPCRKSLEKEFDGARMHSSLIFQRDAGFSPIWGEGSLLWVDLYYVPKRLWERFHQLSPIFQEHRVVNELAIGGILTYANFLVDLEAEIAVENATPHVDIICAGSCCSDINAKQLTNRTFLYSKENSCGHKVNLGNGDSRRALIKAWEGEELLK